MTFLIQNKNLFALLIMWNYTENIMFKLFDFILHGCWHKWTVKDELQVWNHEKPEAKRPIGLIYVLQCEKCGRLHHYNAWWFSHVLHSSASEGSMDFLTTFLAISLQNLNLFSFILGMVYTLLSVTIYSQKKLWFQIVLYVSIVALYFYFKSEAKNVPIS